MKGFDRRNWRGRRLGRRRRKEGRKREGDTYQAWMGWQPRQVASKERRELHWKKIGDE